MFPLARRLLGVEAVVQGWGSAFRERRLELVPVKEARKPMETW